MRKYGLWIIPLFLVLWILALCVLRPISTKGPSMYPTTKETDYMMCSKTAYLFSEPKRGDIVLFESETFGEIVKRVIGLPGETVEIRHGTVYIDDTALEEPYMRDWRHSEYSPVTVPDNCAFVLGDNRIMSMDSRYEEIGMVQFKDIKCKIILHLWPIYWVSNPLAQ